MIRDVGTRARVAISELLQRPAHLKLHVKIEPDWTTSPEAMAELGYQGMSERRPRSAAGRAGRAAQRRQVVAVQPPGRRPAGAGRGHAGRDARSPLRRRRLGTARVPRRRHRRPRSLGRWGSWAPCARRRCARSTRPTGRVRRRRARGDHRRRQRRGQGAAPVGPAGAGGGQQGRLRPAPRRPPARPSRSASPTSSRSPPATAAASASCSTRWSPSFPRRRVPATPGEAAGAGRDAPNRRTTGRLAARLRRQAQRRQVVAGEPPARRGAGAGPRPAGHDARSDRHAVLVRRARVRAGRHRRHAPPPLDRHADRAGRGQDGARPARSLRRRRAGDRRPRGGHRRGRPAGQPDRGLGPRALVVLNKKDLVGRAAIDAKVESTREQLAFLRYAPVLLTSAVTRAGVTAILAEAAQGARAGVAPHLHRRAQQAARADRRPPAAAGRPGRAPRAPLLRDAGLASARRPSSSAPTTRPRSATPTAASSSTACARPTASRGRRSAWSCARTSKRRRRPRRPSPRPSPPARSKKREGR